VITCFIADTSGCNWERSLGGTAFYGFAVRTAYKSIGTNNGATRQRRRLLRELGVRVDVGITPQGLKELRLRLRAPRRGQPGRWPTKGAMDPPAGVSGIIISANEFTAISKRAESVVRSPTPRGARRQRQGRKKTLPKEFAGAIETSLEDRRKDARAGLHVGAIREDG